MLRSAPAGLGFIKPELPTLVPEPATGEGWIDDGYRTLMTIDRGRVRAFTRNGNDWTRAHKRVIAFAADPTPTRSVPLQFQPNLPKQIYEKNEHHS